MFKKIMTYPNTGLIFSLRGEKMSTSYTKNEPRAALRA